MGRFLFTVGFAVGYVLGAKAGTKRYDQIARLARRIKDNPKVQGVAGVLEAQAESAVQSVRAKLGNEQSPAGLNGHAR